MDVAIRIATVTTLIISCLLFLMSSRNWRWSLCVGALILSIASFVINNGPANSLIIPDIWVLITHILTKLAVGFLWLFLLATFKENFRFKPLYFLIFAGWVFFSFFGAFKLNLDALPIGTGFLTITYAVALIAHGLWHMIRGYSGDLSLARRQARMWLGLCISLAILIDIAVDLVMGFNWRGPAFLMGQNLFAGLGALLTILSLWRADLTSWVGPDIDPIALGPPQEQSADANLILDLMREEKLFLNPALRFNEFAAHLPLSEPKLRKTINHELGFGHFTNFVNHFRVDHAKALLQDPDRAHEKIIAIALDSGFNSLPSFQRVFKQSVGMSPTKWKMRNRID